MTIRSLAAAAVIAAVAGAACLANAAPVEPTSTAQELAALRVQLAALQERLAELEQAHQAQETVNSELQESIDRTSDNLARTVGEGASSGWMGRWVWQGDLRARNEHIDQEATVAERNRSRFRLRVGAVARVNDNTRVEVQFASGEGADARSANQSFTDANSRKALDLDIAQVEWAPNDQWRLTVGKMRQPWVRTSSFFFDGDITPEGLALRWQPRANGFFGTLFATELAERATAADSGVLGAQIGWREARSDGRRWLLAGAFYDHFAVRGYNPFQGASSVSAGVGSYGNTTTTSAAVCRRAVGASPCLVNDYNIVELLGEYQFNVGEQPLLLFANVAQNTAAEAVGIAPDALDSAYAAGFTFGRATASIPGTWELGYLYQVVEKDALFAQWIDSDFAAGNTDGGGSAFRAAYQVSRNWRFNLTYMLNETNRDVGAAVTVPNSRTLLDRDYRRLQIDFNWTY